MMRQMADQSQVKYPALNMYSCPRVSGQRVDNTQIPLLKYRGDISANNCSKNYEGNFVDSSMCRKFLPKDGLVYSMKKMKNEIPQKNIIRALICVCMYNQSKHAINLTLNGIYRDLKYFRNSGVSDGQIAVVLIQDGILKLVSDRKRRTYAQGENSMIEFYKKLDHSDGKSKCDLQERINIILDEMQNFDRKGMSGNVQRNRDFPPSIEKNIALVYQNLWKPSMTYFESQGQQQVKDDESQLRLFSCFKHTNGTKLSSHLWFFQGFCRYFKPEFCVLLDVGTKADEKGLYNLIKGFSSSKDVGGVTGFMSIDASFKSQQGGQSKEQKQNCCTSCFASIQKAQQYQYIIAHFLDKNAESSLGFLHVLPGAWSAYRYEALIKSQRFQQNLLERSYFKMILDPDQVQSSYKEANMYLAEDRILSLGIYCQMDSQYTLKYVPDAVAFTDPMKNHENLLNQRRRWINSSLFAFLYVFNNFYYNVMDSKHNCFRKYITLPISMFLALLSFFFSFITPSIFFFVLYATISQLGARIVNSEGQTIDISSYIAQVVTFIYTMVFLSAVAGALTGKQWAKSAHVVSVFFALFNALMFALVIYNVIVTYLVLVDDPIQGTAADVSADSILSSPKMMIIIITGCITIGSLVLILLFHLFTHPRYVWKLIIDTPSYFFYTGAYAQTMVIHGFCNVDDVSWGTKGSTDSHGGKKYEIKKVFFVSNWLFWNAFLAYIFIYIDVILKNVEKQGVSNYQERGGWVLLAIAILGASTIAIKTLLALWYHFKWWFTEKCFLKIDGDDRRKQQIDAFWKKQFIEWRKNFERSSLNHQSMVMRR